MSFLVLLFRGIRKYVNKKLGISGAETAGGLTTSYSDIDLTSSYAGDVMVFRSWSNTGRHSATKDVKCRAASYENKMKQKTQFAQQVCLNSRRSATGLGSVKLGTVGIFSNE